MQVPVAGPVAGLAIHCRRRASWPVVTVLPARIPTCQKPAYQKPAYQTPAYQMLAYQTPAYQMLAYQTPAYQTPAYQMLRAALG